RFLQEYGHTTCSSHAGLRLMALWTVVRRGLWNLVKMTTLPRPPPERVMLRWKRRRPRPKQDSIRRAPRRVGAWTLPPPAIGSPKSWVLAITAEFFLLKAKLARRA
ncbi:unnamed protein product, partial [Symbiodinium sp. KB8]